MIPFWLKLLREHTSYGLTLPFLVGAMRTPIGTVVADRNECITEVKGLLSSMRDETPDTSYIFLKVCDRLHQPVFAECSSYFTPSDLYARIPMLEGKKCFLYVAQSILSREKEHVEDLLVALWQRNGEEILQGKFSYRNGAYTTYSEKNIMLISNASNQTNEE